MKRCIFKKKVLIGLVVIMVLTINNLTYAAESPINVFLDTKYLNYENEPSAYIDITTNRTMVPVRFVSEGLGAQVSWNEVTREVYIYYIDKIIVLPENSKYVTINNEIQEIDAPAQMVKSRIFVPLRFVSEVMGANVEWDGCAHIYYSVNSTPEEDHRITGIPVSTPPAPKEESIFPELVQQHAANNNYVFYINTQKRDLTYFENGQVYGTYPVGVGRLVNGKTLTPKGVFKVYAKVVNPPYYEKGIPGGSPNNPLGYRVFWFYGDYGIHGNADPGSIGKYVSAGCVRMNNEDVLHLFERAPIGTTVIID